MRDRMAMYAMLVAGSLLAGIGSAVEAGVPAVPAQPGESVERLAAEVRNRGWICFSARSEKGDWDLFVCRPHGSGRRKMTDTREFNEAGARF